MITFTCKGKGCSPRQWEGSLEILQKGNPCEAELCARGSRFHLIVGKLQIVGINGHLCHIRRTV